MFLLVHFPFSDCRHFLEQETGNLNRPTWPSPQADREFVRSFGCVRNRKKGGLKGWLGENVICEADRAIRFNNLTPFANAGPAIKVSFRIAFRRLYFDGIAVGKYEIGMVLNAKSNPSKLSDYLYFFAKDTASLLNREYLIDTIQDFFLYLSNAPRIRQSQGKRLLEHILQLEVRPNSSGSSANPFSLINAGSHISEAYCVSTTKASFKKTNKIEPWWVTHGKPVIFLQCNSDEKIRFPFYHTKIKIPEFSKVKLTCYSVPFQGIHVHLWVAELRDNASTTLNFVRTLRLYLLRLHAEHESLRDILRKVDSKQIVFAPYTKESNFLQHYLNEATRRISRYEHRSQDLLNQSDRIAEIARRTKNSISSGESDSILSFLRNVKARHNILKKVEKYLECEKNISEKSSAIYAENIYLGDAYYAEQVNAQGVGVMMENPNIKQTFNATVGNAVGVNQGEMIAYIGKSSEEIIRLITSLQEISQSFPEEQKEAAAIQLSDLTNDFNQPTEPHKARLKTRIIGLLSIAISIAGAVATTTDFANNVLELSNKLEVPVKAIQPKLEEFKKLQPEFAWSKD